MCWFCIFCIDMHCIADISARIHPCTCIVHVLQLWGGSWLHAITCSQEIRHFEGTKLELLSHFQFQRWHITCTHLHLEKFKSGHVHITTFYSCSMPSPLQANCGKSLCACPKRLFGHAHKECRWYVVFETGSSPTGTLTNFVSSKMPNFVGTSDHMQPSTPCKCKLHKLFIVKLSKIK